MVSSTSHRSVRVGKSFIDYIVTEDNSVCMCNYGFGNNAHLRVQV